jgi:hypothetical protein
VTTEREGNPTELQRTLPGDFYNGWDAPPSPKPWTTLADICPGAGSRDDPEGVMLPLEMPAAVATREASS